MRKLLRRLRAVLGRAAVLALLLSSAAAARGATPAGTFSVQAIMDVPYYDGPGADRVKHRLDLFLPRGHRDYPVVLFVHGGAWLRGDKGAYWGVYGSVGRMLARHGIGVAVTNYRLSPAVMHPEHVRDVARAFAWLHHHVGRYGGRPDQLFVCGH